MIKYVLIDLDGTILDFSKGERNAFKETINKFLSIDLNEDDIKKFSKINEYYFNEYHKKNMTRDEFHYKRFDEIFKYLGKYSDPIIADSYYMESLKYQANPFDDVYEALEYLSKKYNLYIASNGITSIQKKRLEVASLINYFKELYVSNEITYNKPEKEFFDYVFKDTNDYNKDSYVIIGDRLDTDILGGINAGIHTIYLNRSNIFDSNIKSEFEIKTFDEIKNIL